MFNATWISRRVANGFLVVGWTKYISKIVNVNSQVSLDRERERISSRVVNSIFFKSFGKNRESILTTLVVSLAKLSERIQIHLIFPYSHCSSKRRNFHFSSHIKFYLVVFKMLLESIEKILTVRRSRRDFQRFDFTEGRVTTGDDNSNSPSTIRGSVTASKHPCNTAEEKSFTNNNNHSRQALSLSLSLSS